MGKHNVKQTAPVVAKSEPVVAKGSNDNAKKLLGVVLALVFSYYVWSSGATSIVNLAKGSAEQVATFLKADDVSVVYCIKGHKGDDMKNVPQVFKDLHAERGNKYNFGLLDCNKKLPSGQTILERFKINRKIKPTIFMTAPWMGSARGVGKQVPDGQQNDIKSIKKYVDTAVAPRATDVQSDSELNRACGWNKKTYTNDTNSVGSTCIAFFKGKRYSKSQHDLQEHIIRAYPNNRYVSLSASKKRFGLSFDIDSDIDANDYALRVHAMRNGTHHMTLTNPATFEYISTFISAATSSKLSDYTEANDVIAVTKDKKSTSGFKDRAPPVFKSSSNDDNNNNEQTKKKELTPEEIEAARLAKERRAREQMDKMEQDAAIEADVDGDNSDDEEEMDDEDEEEEEIMEL
jgi:hypothetical protein